MGPSAAGQRSAQAAMAAVPPGKQGAPADLSDLGRITLRDVVANQAPLHPKVQSPERLFMYRKT